MTGESPWPSAEILPSHEWAIGPYRVVQATEADVDKIWSFRQDARDRIGKIPGTGNQYAQPFQHDEAAHKEIIRESILKGETFIGLDPDNNEDVFTFAVKGSPDPFMWPAAEREEPAWYLSRFMVRQKYKGQGIGTMVLDELCSRAAQADQLWLRIEIWDEDGEPNSGLMQYYYDHDFVDLQSAVNSKIHFVHTSDAVPAWTNIEWQSEGFNLSGIQLRNYYNRASLVHPADFRMQRRVEDDDISEITASLLDRDPVPQLTPATMRAWRRGLMFGEVYFCPNASEGWLEEPQGPCYGDDAKHMATYADNVERFDRFKQGIGLARSLLRLTGGRETANERRRREWALRVVALEKPARGLEEFSRKLRDYQNGNYEGPGVLVAGPLTIDGLLLLDETLDLSVCDRTFVRMPRGQEVGMQRHDPVLGDGYMARITAPRGSKWHAEMLWMPHLRTQN